MELIHNQYLGITSLNTEVSKIKYLIYDQIFNKIDFLTGRKCNKQYKSLIQLDSGNTSHFKMRDLGFYIKNKLSYKHEKNRHVNLFIIPPFEDTWKGCQIQY